MLIEQEESKGERVRINHAVISGILGALRFEQAIAMFKVT